MHYGDEVMVRGLGSLGEDPLMQQVADAVVPLAREAAAAVESTFGVKVPEQLLPTRVPTHTGPPAPVVANPGLQQDSLAAWVHANPELAGVLLLGGAFMAYKAGSLVGGLVAGGAALLYGGQILSGLGANSQPAPVIVDDDPVEPLAPPSVDPQEECQARGGTWVPTPMFCDGFGVGGCPQGFCQDTKTVDPGNWFDWNMAR